MRKRLLVALAILLMVLSFASGFMAFVAFMLSGTGEGIETMDYVIYMFIPLVMALILFVCSFILLRKNI